MVSAIGFFDDSSHVVAVGGDDRHTMSIWRLDAEFALDDTPVIRVRTFSVFLRLERYLGWLLRARARARARLEGLDSSSPKEQRRAVRETLTRERLSRDTPPNESISRDSHG